MWLSVWLLLLSSKWPSLVECFEWPPLLQPFEWPSSVQSAKRPDLKAEDAMQLYYMAMAMNIEVPSTIKPLPEPEPTADVPTRSAPNFATLTAPQRKMLNGQSNKTRFMNTVQTIAIPRPSGTPGNLEVQQVRTGPALLSAFYNHKT